MMKSYSQRNPLWAQTTIPQTSLTIGRWGCTITCIADLSTYFGDNLTPLDTLQTLKFTQGGLILWSSCSFPHFKFLRREYGRVDNNIKTAIQDPDQAVILQVANESHWVVATGVTWLGSFKIADPWFGDFSTIKRYQNNITGAAYFERIKI